MKNKQPHEVARSIGEGAALVITFIIGFMALVVVALVAAVAFFWLIELAGRLMP